VALQRWSPGDDLFGAAPATSPGGDPRPAELLAQLDDAVFDLFEFTDDERALVREQLTIATEYLKHGIDASVLGRATLPPATSGLAADLDLPSSADRAAVGSLPAYLQTLLAVWNPEVAPHDVEFRWRVVRPSGVNVLAVVLEPVSRFDPGTPVTDTDELTREVARLGRALPTPLSRRLFTEGVVRAVADSGIVIVRRDERRLWSRTTAREDADATMLQVMRLHDARADERPTIDAALGGRATTSSPSV
jgi:hypothetical protein